MSLDLTTAGDILKIDYQEPLREQLNNAHILLTRVRKETRNYVGKQAYLPLHVGRNVGIGARAEKGTLPTAGNQQYDSATFTPTYQYGRILLNGPTIAAMKSNKGAFVRAIQSETRGLLIDMKQDVQRQVWRDGSSILTQCGTTSSSTSVNVNSTKYLEAGMEITIAQTADGGDSTTGRTVSSVTDDTTFVISGAAVTTDSGDSITRKDTRDLTDWGTPLELWGLEAVVSDADPGNGLSDTFGNVARSNTFWQANKLDNGGTNRALTLDLMQQAVDETDIESDFLPGLILTNHAIKRRYASLLQADKRYPEGGEITLDGGYRALEFNGIPLVADKDAGTALDPSALNRLYFLTMGSLEWEVLEDFQWMEEDGAVLSRVADKDQYEATMFAYLQLAAEQCNSHAFLTDIDEAA